ncbi:MULTISPECIES: type 4a pilus biogenesis protein PilO [unclassified Alteromonas]|uniref:type 4a pilus biogenesis protein PilO n=1 Tax=unclassified Alteromonas TaxID=2614992 RepID=UPI000C5F9851|nr:MULTISPECIES: type 4a pilus biogenesis protein PilO [unclassified Alteromonas]AYA65895.1 pilus assembly protein PilP [Alteromonas sp. RKMC-009]MBT81200.1 pilus assembly protein PilP [Alteromonadaceae bacterium]MDO6473808.1 type 4a pilus biogenesis protein PilO [Alteromonas sp. 1_MG-2023]MEC7691177.1 type 4a pilus biogenesis protein PilO [Pseudomonadota bacterium]
MSFDFSKLKELNELDFEQVAIWSKEVKLVVMLFVIIVVGALSYWFIVKPKLPVLEQAEIEEQELKMQFQAKYRIAVNLNAYMEQLKQIEADFSTMLRSLPTSNETPGLLDDITYVGTTSGLTFKLLNWQQEVPKEFYTELPIEIEVSGGYHNFGEFVSEIADLPRIVTLHDFEIVHEADRLNLQMQAKTYRTSMNSQQGAKQP